MSDKILHDCHILVAEDEYLLADDLTDALNAAGAVILGPVPTVDVAMSMIEQSERIDLAIVDVNLRGVMAYPVADALVARSVPFAFASGYDACALPERFAGAVHLEKPFKLDRALQVLHTLLA